ncbi:unnamed protein product [Ilex paraguariensis]|uniref:Uncharacterized protein n=1 Tax=Ilex paraguariensis TaxID=185542 RepID=A0ABC8QR74_9AQUA
MQLDKNQTMLSSKWTILDSIYRCTNLRSFRQIHAQLIISGVIHDDFIVNKVAELFGKSVEFVDYACNFWNKHGSFSNLLPFNTIIAGFAGGNRPEATVLVYRQLIRRGVLPDMYTFPAVLKSCRNFLGFAEGKQIHGVGVKMGFWCDLYVQNSVLHLYSACGQCSDASRVFDEMLVRDVVSWTSLISGYVRAGLFYDAIRVFFKMDVKPNIAAFISVLVACGRLGHVNLGTIIHGLILKHGFGMGLVVNNALLDMYVKCACLCEGKQLFNELPEIDIVSWTCMISGLVQCKAPEEALELFSAMQKSGVEPDKVILTSVLSACASLGALDYGRWVHEHTDRKGIKWDIHIGTAMVDMYAKCGCIELALQIFNGMSCRNVFTWNALLGGLAMHGHGHKALEHFDQMVRIGIRPNEVTFLSILTACCHSGLVDEGREYFYQMISHDYNLSPKLEHYGCMVDLLCRAGLLDEAQEIIRRMPMPPDVLIWGSLLSACKANENLLSHDVLDRLHELESEDSGVYVLLSNIYATNERWDAVSTMRRLMKEKGIRKTPGSSVIEVDGKAHEFIFGDTTHPQSEDIHALLYIFANLEHPEVHYSCPFLLGE